MKMMSQDFKDKMELCLLKSLNEINIITLIDGVLKVDQDLSSNRLCEFDNSE